MKTFAAVLLPLVASAIISCEARIYDPYRYAVGRTPSEPFGVKWKQTRDSPSRKHGGLGSSVEGFFPQMSPKKIGMGCGLDWKDGQIHAGFDGGDPDNGAGGGFTWMPNALSSIVGVHYKDTKINLNLTITDRNEVLFSINDRPVDWKKVTKLQTKKETVRAQEQKPDGQGVERVQYDEHGRPFSVGTPVYFRKPGDNEPILP